ncbi:MAG: SMC-Scp complex subunit ScpB [Myxococcota bacterium]
MSDEGTPETEADGSPRHEAEASDEGAIRSSGEEPAGTRPGVEKTRPQVHGEAHLKTILESLVFVADKPVSVQRMARITRAKPSELKPLLDELVEEYANRGVQLLEVGGGYQFRSSAVNAPFVRDMVSQRPVRLTRAQLETLAIVAYRQPVTRPEIEDIRGVDSGSAVKVLAERGLLKILGRKDEPGRPLIYGTTPYFLEFFGLSSLKDLPTLEEFTELSEESRALFQRKIEDLDLTRMEAIDEGAIPEVSEEDDADGGEVGEDDRGDEGDADHREDDDEDDDEEE